jgi:phage baseplate assembly protein W
MAQKNIRTFSDISLGFGSNPVTADVVEVTGEDAVKTAIRNLISTKNFDRPFHPEIGCGIHNLLFENFTPLTLELAKRTVFDILKAYEPRAVITNIRIGETQDLNELTVTVEFKLVNSDKPLTVTTILNKAR